MDDELVIFRTRCLDGITNAMRVMFDGNPHNIREVADFGNTGQRFH